jgi:hypothetical protein
MNLMIRSLAFVFFCACTGGGGTISDVPDIERPPTTFERPNERARTGATRPDNDEDRTNQPTQGTGLDCSGTYTCREGGVANSFSTITLDGRDPCTFGSFVLERDGRVTSGANEVGTWVVTSSGLTIVASGRTLTCTK